MEINGLKPQGWSIAAIARLTGHDRKMIRAYLNGERESGVRMRPATDPFDLFEA